MRAIPVSSYRDRQYATFSRLNNAKTSIRPRIIVTDKAVRLMDEKVARAGQGWPASGPAP
jgi:hypothetical protein